MKQLTIQRESLSFLALTRNTVGLLEPIYLQETYIRAGSTLKEARDHSYQFSRLLWETEVFHSGIAWEHFYMLYQQLLRDYGYCIGKILREQAYGKPIHIGYTFRKWQHNEEESFIKDTWVRLYHRNIETHQFESVHLS